MGLEEELSALGDHASLGDFDYDVEKTDAVDEFFLHDEYDALEEEDIGSDEPSLNIQNPIPINRMIGRIVIPLLYLNQNKPLHSLSNRNPRIIKLQAFFIIDTRFRKLATCLKEKGLKVEEIG